MITRARALLLAVPLSFALSACGDQEPMAPAIDPAPSFSETVLDVPQHELAYVTTDKADYQPGDRVHVTGAGFAPGETVTLTFEETPRIHEAHTLETVADENGRISNGDYLIEEHDLGQAFTLTAMGEDSEFMAQQVFTDFHNAVSVDPSLTNAGQGVTLRVSGNYPGSVSCLPLTVTSFSYRILLERESGFGAPDVETAAQNLGNAVRASFNGRPPGIDLVFVVAQPNNPFCGPAHTNRDGTLTWRQPNQPPVANAGPDRTVFRTDRRGAEVTLEGSASDPDGNEISATWHLPPDNPAAFASDLRPTVLLPGLGEIDLLLRVRDNQGGVDTDVVVWTLLNNPPVAEAGPNQTVECTSHHGTPVTLDGSGSTDKDGDVVAYEWLLDGNVIATGVNPTVTLPLGSHTITLRVRDNDGDTGTDDVVVRVVDTTPPEISMDVSPTTLWPPNHNMVQVASAISATDICDPAPTLAVHVTSDEAVNGEGDGNTDPDWVVTQNPDGTFDVSVRAERAGDGDGRVYTITATATDASGNQATQSATVEVPHDQRRDPPRRGD